VRPDSVPPRPDDRSAVRPDPARAVPPPPCPDLELLRELVTAAPSVRVASRGEPRERIEAAETVTGPLPESFRWWLAEYGGGRVDGTWLAQLPAPGFEDDPDSLPGRRDAGGLWFLAEEGGDSYALLNGELRQGECPVIRRDALTGETEPYADTFAGFLALRVALASGLRDGPNPAVARLWRRTPGLRLPGGGRLYGPHEYRDRNEPYGTGHRHGTPWTLVGDDGTGAGLLMRHHGRDRDSLYRLPLEHIGQAGPGGLGPGGDVPDGAERVTGDLWGWLTEGGRL
jgi:hypothetical protein